MTPSKILITGATGFIGTRLCELLSLEYGLPYRALVRNLTRANRIARLGADMVVGDLMRLDTLRAALDGCDAVVHLAHSEDRTAPRETANLLRECLRGKVRRFVHMSSMAVHGPDPGPDCASERTAVIRRYYGEAYSDSKAAVEKLVRRAMLRRRLPGVILRPTVVYGPYSPFVTQVVERARQGVVTLVEGGRGICNAVFVDDVCAAVHAALTNDRSLGGAFFITGDDHVEWKDFVLTFSHLVDPDLPVQDYSLDEIRQEWKRRRPTVWSNVRSLIRLAASPEFQRSLSTVPALRSAINSMKRVLKKVLPAGRITALKRSLRGRPAAGGTAAGAACPDAGRVVRENVWIKFRNELAEAALGWRPAFDFARGARVTASWLRFARLVPAATCVV